MFINGKMEESILVSTKRIKRKDMGNIFGQTVNATADGGTTVSSMV